MRSGKIVELERYSLSWKDSFEIGKTELSKKYFGGDRETIGSWKDVSVVEWPIAKSFQLKYFSNYTFQLYAYLLRDFLFSVDDSHLIPTD